MKLLFAGTPEPAARSLGRLLEAGRHEVVGVLTRPDAPSGRGRRSRSSAVADLAREHGLPVHTPPGPGDPAFRAVLADVDCVPVVAYGALVAPAALSVPRHGWINLHFSLLPAWRGAAPVQWAVISGDTVTGASTFQLERGLDTGPVYGVVTETVRDRDTAGDLLGRLADAGADLLAATLDGVASGELHAVAQPTDGVSLAPKLTPADARVRWRDPAVAVDRRIRGCTPAPGAWTTVDDERLKLGPVRPAPAAPRVEPGILAVDRHGVHVGTGTHPVRLDLVQPAGRRMMPVADWLRGLAATPPRFT